MSEALLLWIGESNKPGRWLSFELYWRGVCEREGMEFLGCLSVYQHLEKLDDNCKTARRLDSQLPYSPKE